RESDRVIPAGRTLRGTHLQGRETSKPTGDPGYQARTGHKSQNSQGARAGNSSEAARHRRRGDRMRRREFITLLGAAAIVSPYSVLGQTRDRAPRVGMLMGLPESDSLAKTRVEEFEQGLRELGLRDGRDIHIDYRWTTVNSDQAVRNAKELIDLNPDVIVVSSTPGLAALLQETSTIPIVFMTVADPVA